MIDFASAPTLPSEDGLISALRQGEKQALEYVYRSCWPMIAHFVWLNQGRQEEAEDLFQDGIIILLEKLRQQDFHLRHSLSTYLYAICRNHWLKRLQDKQRFMLKDTAEYLEHLPELEGEEVALPDDQTLYEAIEQLKHPCYTLLMGYYYQKMSLEQLAQVLNYSTPNVAKQRKFRCLERLKKIFLP